MRRARAPAADKTKPLSGGKDRSLLELPLQVARGAVRGALEGAKEWWGDDAAAAAAAAKAAALADEVADVRRALIDAERAQAAAERAAAAATGDGRRAPNWSALVALDMARDRTKALKALEASLTAAQREPQRVQRVLDAAVAAAPPDAKARLVALQREGEETLAALAAAVAAGAEARRVATAARAEAASKRTRVLPEWGGATKEGKEGKADKADKASEPIILTDVLIHGIARREYEPMRILLQALRDAAFDCKVLHGLHARMGIETHCAID